MEIADQTINIQANSTLIILWNYINFYNKFVYFDVSCIDQVFLIIKTDKCKISRLKNLNKKKI